MSVYRLFRFSNNSFSSYKNLLCSREGFQSFNNQRAFISNKVLEKLGIPLKPKRPCSPYIRFLENSRPRIKENNPELKSTEIVKVLAKEWKKCDSEQKKALQKEFLSELDVYLKEIDIYKRSITPQQKNIIKCLKEKEKNAKEQTRINVKKVDLGKPKKPATAFIKFMQEAKSQKDDNIKYIEWLRRVAREWETLSDERKDKYKNEAKDALDKYKVILADWEEEMIREGHYDVVRNTEVLVHKKKLNKSTD